MKQATSGAVGPMDPTEPDEGFRTGLANGELLLSFCGVCSTVLDYSQRFCTACNSDKILWHAGSGSARLRCVVEISVSYAPELPAPFLIASVQLEEGPHLLARYDGSMESAHEGKEVVAIIKGGELRFLPA